MPTILPQIHIPSPCHENWNKMSRVEQGRFCKSCQKTVTDFTEMDDEGLVAFLSENKTTEACGRFRPDQLTKTKVRPLPVRIFNYYIRYAAVSVLALFFPRNSQAQEEKNSAIAEDGNRLPPVVKDVYNDSIVYLFHGKVTDAMNGQALDFATITIHRGDSKPIQVGYTDYNGNYRVEVATLKAEEGFRMVISRKSYKDYVIENAMPSVEPKHFALKHTVVYNRRRAKYHRHSSGFYMAQ
jgi:hypothetical protein